MNIRKTIPILALLLALVLLASVPMIVTFVVMRRKKMMSVSRAVKQRTAGINAEIESSISGIRVAKAFGNEDMEITRFDAANVQFRQAAGGFYKAMAQFHSAMEFLLCSLNVIVIGVGGYFVMQGDMDYRDLLTFTLYISSFVSPMRKLSGFSEMFANGFAGLNRFVTIMRTEPTMIIGALSSMFVDLYRVKLAESEGLRPESVSEAFGYGKSSFKLKRAAQTGRRMSQDSVKAALLILRDTDLAIKTSRGDSRIIIERAVILLMRAVAEAGL